MTALSVRGATVLRGKHLAAEDVSFSAPQGGLTALLGPAASGKTSLLAAVAGLLKMERGTVLVDGTDVSRMPARRRGIRMLAPGSVLVETGAVLPALRRLAGPGAAPLLEQMGLAHLAGQEMSGLSQGEALLVLSAARLAKPGGLLLVDEAGSGLDEAACDRLLAAMRGIAGATTLVFATRVRRLALAADHLVLLAGGHVLQAGPPASLYAEPRDSACAALTGEANILSGHIREVRPGGFIWAAGSRFAQATEPGTPRPVLGNGVSLCLRPERLAVLAEGERADNEIEADVVSVRFVGAAVQVELATPLGPLRATVPAWPGWGRPGQGQRVRAGWAATAPSLFAAA